MNETRGKFITFEGCDGCGKSTQLKLLSDYLLKNALPHIFTREPGGGKISEAIRRVLLDGKNSEMTDECEALLYAAKLVICDRYVDSSLAYQAGGRGIDEAFVKNINSYALEQYLPDATIFIDLSPEEAFCRKHGADKNDRLEQAGMEFHRRVYASYKTLASENPARIVTIDGRNTPQGIFDNILRALRERRCL